MSKQTSRGSIPGFSGGNFRNSYHSTESNGNSSWTEGGINRVRSNIALTSNPLPASFKEYIRTEVHKDAGWVVQNFNATDDGGLIADALRAGHCVGISDGSFKDEYGTACWVVKGETSQGRIFGPCITPGNAKDQSAYQSELAGLYGIITMLEAICQYHAVTAGNAEIGCDGIQALR